MGISADRYLTEMFTLGTTYSDPIEVLPDIKVIFRLLPTEELIEVSEIVSQYQGLEARMFVSQIQTLARAVVEINSMVLMLPAAEADAIAKEVNKTTLTRVEQAENILMSQFPKFLLDELNQAYLNFYQSVLEKVEEIKKKLTSSSKKGK